MRDGIVGVRDGVVCEHLCRSEVSVRCLSLSFFTPFFSLRNVILFLHLLFVRLVWFFCSVLVAVLELSL